MGTSVIIKKLFTFFVAISFMTFIAGGESDRPDLRATEEEGSILLEWDHTGDGVTGYRIYRGLTEDSRYLYTELDDHEGRSYRDEEVEVGRTYRYWITAIQGDAESRCSETAYATKQGRNVPTEPTDVKAYPNDSSVTIRWDLPEDDGNRDIRNYKLYRAEEGEDFVELHSLGTVYQYRDNSVQNGIRYRYRVSARNVVGWGAESESNEVYPSADVEHPDRPTDLLAYPGSEHVELIWGDPEYDGGSSVYNYRVYKNGDLIATVDDNHYRDHHPAGSNTYYVSAVNAAGEGHPSMEKTTESHGRPYSDLSITYEARDGSIRISWESEGSFIVYRGHCDEVLVPHEVVNDSGYTDNDAEYGRRYYYRVAALEDDHIVAYSDIIGATATEVVEVEEDGHLSSTMIKILLVMLAIGAASASVFTFYFIKGPKGPDI